MSKADVAPPPSGLQIQDPTTGHSEILPDPSPGPDGRTTGDEVVKKTNPQGQSKDDINVEYNDIGNQDKDIVIHNEHLATTDNTENMSEVKIQGTAKVTEFKTSEMAGRDSKDSVKGDETTGHVVDIVKQSKIGDTTKTATSDFGDFPEFPQSRPLTEISNRDGTRMSYDTEDKKEQKTETERDTKSPFSVNVERKPLHTAQTRSHSDYYSKTPSSSRYTYIAASLSQFHGFQGDYVGKENFMGFRHQQRHMVKARRQPPKLVRLATVTMSPKTKPVPRGPSLYYEEPKKPSKVITWDEANDARPPLRIDMEGPGPTQYSPRIKPLSEANAPAWTFGSKCFIEKTGGSRTSWEKTWFQSPNVWTNKVDFHNDSAWPTPTHYKSRPMLGPRQRTMAEPPSFTIGTRKEMTLNKAGSDKEPSPTDYDKDTADKLVMKRGPSFTHQFRRDGTVIWQSKEKVPGPGAYSPKFSYNKHHGPSYSIRSLRREKSHILGPFSTF